MNEHRENHNEIKTSYQRSNHCKENSSSWSDAYFAKKMLTYLEASRQQRYIHERWPVSKRVNNSRASGDDSTLIERSRYDR